MAGTVVWLDVLPSLTGFSAMLAKQTGTAARDAGVSAGKQFSTGMSSGAAGAADAAKALVDQLTTAASKAARVVKQEQVAITNARNAEKAAAESVGVAEARLAEQRAKYGEASSQALRAEQQLTVARNGAQAAAGKASLNEGRLRAALDEQKVTTDQLTLAQDKLSTAQDRATGPMERFRGGIGAGATAIGGFKSAVGGALKSVGSLGVMFGEFAIAGFVAKSFKAASDFQASMNLLVTAGGESRSALGLVSAGVQQVAVSTGTTVDQLSAGMYTIEKAQIRGADAVKLLKAAAEGAKAEGADMATMTNALTSIMRSYNIPASQAVTVTNELVAAAGVAKTTMQNYAGSLSTVLPIAAAAGISFAQVGGAIATITQHGTSADEATQELANTIRGLMAPNNVAVQQMSKLGLSANDVSQNLGKRGLTGTIDILMQAVTSHMGPAGLVLQNTFNQSKIAAQDANMAFLALPKAAAKVATGFAGGTLSLKDYRTALKALPTDQAALVTQWVAMENKSKGFNQQLRNGVSSSQTASAALKQMLGGATGLNTALMLTGGSAGVFTNNVNSIAAAANKSGKDISTWASTQKLFKTQISELGQTIAVTGQQIATKMLPPLMGIVKSLMSGMQAGIKFASANKSWLEPTVLGVLAFASSFKLAGLAITGVTKLVGIAKAVGFAWIAVTQGMTAAQTAFDVAADANPLGLVVLAIEAVVAVLAALVAGVIYAYNHWKWFHDGVNAVWQGVVTAAQWAWKNVLKPTFDFIGKAVQDVGGFFSWLWKNAVEPAWNGISKAVGAVWKGFLKPIFDTIGKVVKGVGDVFTWLWKNVVTPVFNGIVGVVSWFYQFFDAIFTLIGAIIKKTIAPLFTWLWKNIIQPAWDGIVAGLKTVGGWFTWLWKNAIEPAWNGIVGAVQWAWGIISKAFAAVWDYLSKTLGPVFTWLWKTIIEPAWNGISDAIKTVWDKFISPALHAFHDFIHDTLPDAFKTFGDIVKTVWDGIKTAAMVPVKFVIDTLYNQGIRATFNSAADFFEGKGAVHLPAIPLPKGLAGGGVIPGFQAARRDDVLMPMRRGEGVLVPEVVRALGPDFIHRLNAAGNNGGVNGVRSMAGLASGGVVGDILGNVGSFVSSTIGDIGSFVADPLGSLQKVVSGLLHNMPGGQGMLSMAQGFGSKVITDVVAKIKSMFGAHATGFGGGGGSFANPTGSGVTQWTSDVVAALAANGLSTSSDMVAKVLRQIQTESGGNPAAVQHGYTDVNTLSGDLAKGLMQTISATFSAYEFPGHGNIFNGYDNLLAALNYAKHAYGPGLSALGNGHGYAAGGIVPTLYDEGGMLPQGVSLVANKTKKPEFALPMHTLEQIVGGSNNGPHYEPHFHNEGRDFTEQDYMKAQHKMSVLAGGR